MKRVFAIAISLLGGGITAYNVYAIITDPGYYAGSFMVSSATFTALGLALLWCRNMVERQFNEKTGCRR